MSSVVLLLAFAVPIVGDEPMGPAELRPPSIASPIEIENRWHRKAGEIPPRMREWLEEWSVRSGAYRTELEGYYDPNGVNRVKGLIRGEAKESVRYGDMTQRDADEILKYLPEFVFDSTGFMPNGRKPPPRTIPE